MPIQCERQHVLPLAGEPAAVDDPGLAPQDRVEQPGPVVGVVLEVGVLDEHEVAAGLGQAGTDGGALALVRVWSRTRTVESSSAPSTLSVPSDEPSSTTMTSSVRGSSTARMRRMISATVVAR